MAAVKARATVGPLQVPALQVSIGDQQVNVAG